MAIFVSKDRVPVTLDEKDVVYIRPKMSYGIKQQVISSAVKLVGKPGSDDAQQNIDVGAYQAALLVHNIVGWEGPSFRGVKCTEENILEMNPDDALVEKVLDEIGKRNRKEDESDPNRSTPDGA